MNTFQDEHESNFMAVGGVTVGLASDRCEWRSGRSLSNCVLTLNRRWMELQHNTRTIDAVENLGGRVGEFG